MARSALSWRLASVRSSGPVILSLWAAACGEGIGDPKVVPEAATAPRIVALSTYDASLGTLVEAYGDAPFPDGADRRVALRFVGRFEPDADGGPAAAPIPVDVTADARRADASTLRWAGFGPYANPFAPGVSAPGRFVGEVRAKLVDASGAAIESSEGTPVSFRVRPSVVIRELQPLSASCAGPVTRALGGGAYRLRVEAVGFEPERFTYRLAFPAVEQGALEVRTLPRAKLDGIGERGDFVLPEVPRGLASYAAIVSVEGLAKDGKTYATSFALEVTRPLELFYNGNVEVAEIMAPVPVSACIPGGEAGRSVEYAESQSESRAKGFDVNWNQSWLSEHTVERGTSTTIGLNESNGVGFSTSDGQSFNWSLGGEVSGGFSLFDLVEVGMQVSGSRGGGTSRETSASTSRTTGVEASTTTTDTESASQSMGGSTGGGFSWEVSSTETLSRGFGGTVIAGKFGVFYRQTLRFVRRAALVTYNQCGRAEVVADVDFTDWAWSPDLALADACPPLPESNLPKAACLVPPCAGR